MDAIRQIAKRPRFTVKQQKTKQKSEKRLTGKFVSPKESRTILF